MSNEIKKTRSSKAAMLSENLLKQQPELALKIESTLLECINKDVTITNAGIARQSGISIDHVRLLLPHYIKDKAFRIELRCTYVEKHSWDKKAELAKSTVSKLVAQSLTKLTVHVPPVESLRGELNKIVSLRAGLTNNVNQLARWCNTYKEDADAIDVLLQLRGIETQIEAQDKKFDELVSSLRSRMPTTESESAPAPISEPVSAATPLPRTFEELLNYKFQPPEPGIDDDDEYLDCDPAIWEADQGNVFIAPSGPWDLGHPDHQKFLNGEEC